MSRRDWTLYASDMKFQDFCADERTVDAVIRNLEIIGEASKGLRNRIVQKDLPVLSQQLSGWPNES